MIVFTQLRATVREIVADLNGTPGEWCMGKLISRSIYYVLDAAVETILMSLTARFCWSTCLSIFCTSIYLLYLTSTSSFSSSTYSSNCSSNCSPNDPYDPY